MAMSPRGLKAKGKKYEDKIAAFLHTFFLEHSEAYKEIFEHVDNDELRPKRDFASGNLNGSHGDINLNLLKKWFPYAIECKHWKTLDLSLNSIIKGQIAALEKIWEEQCVPKAQECGLHPLIVFRANRTEDFALFRAGARNEEFLTDIWCSAYNFVRVNDFIIMNIKEFIKIHI